MYSNEEISLFSNNICCVFKDVGLFIAIANRLTKKRILLLEVRF